MEKISFKDKLKLSSMDRFSLNKKMKTIPASFFYYGNKETQVKHELDKVELQLEIKESKLSSRYRLRNDKKGLSETHIKALVNASEEIIQLKEKELVLKANLRLLKLKIKSLIMLKETIENIGHNVRNEKTTKGV